MGGNLSGGAELSLTTTLLGRVAGPSALALTRAGARAGHTMWLAGPVGLAAAGFRALSTNAHLAEENAALVAWRRPTARIAEGRAARAAGATAAIDVSDGVAQDVTHLLEASGVGVSLDEAAILAAAGDALTTAAAHVGARAIDLALHGGEDYALIVTLPATCAALAGFVRIGAITVEPGLRLREVSGRMRTIEARGFDHFRG